MEISEVGGFLVGASVLEGAGFRSLLRETGLEVHAEDDGWRRISWRLLSAAVGIMRRSALHRGLAQDGTGSVSTHDPETLRLHVPAVELVLLLSPDLADLDLRLGLLLTVFDVLWQHKLPLLLDLGQRLRLGVLVSLHGGLLQLASLLLQHTLVLPDLLDSSCSRFLVRGSECVAGLVIPAACPAILL